MPEQDFQRRLPAVERLISEIRKEDIRATVIGTVVDMQGDRAVIDDGTGKINVSFGNNASAEPGQMIRIMGRVLSTSDGFEMQGEVAQEMKGLDIDLWKKTRDIRLDSEG